MATSRITCTDRHPPAPIQRPARRLDRRTLLKATAAFVAAAAAAETQHQPQAARAEDGGTRGDEWHQPDGTVAGDWIEFDAAFTFNAVAPHWPGTTGFPAAVEIQLSADGVSWTDAVAIGPAHTDAGPADRDDRIYGDLLFSEAARHVRYRGIDADGSPAVIPGLAFTYIDARSGPGIEDVLANSINAKAGPRFADGWSRQPRPPIISRREWGADRAYGGVDKGTVAWTPWYQTVEHVIIHHSVTPQFRDPLVEIRSIHYYHTVTRGWGDIGYNYLVDYMGNVYEGRAGGENVVGGHAFQYARGSAGICTMGSYAFERPTPEALAGLTWITAWAARHLDPLGRSDFHQTPNLPTICGHRDVVTSTCPGDGLYADLPTIRRAVSDVLRGARQVLSDASYSPGQTIQTTVDGVNMRKLPGTRQAIAAAIPRGAVLHIVEGPTTVDGYSWYEVTGRQGTGWMASAMFAASNAAPPVGPFQVGATLEVDTDYLNIRAEPSVRSGAVATIPFGTTGKVIDGPRPAGGYRWYRLDTRYGKGWAVEHYLAPQGQAKPATRFVVGDAVAVDDRDGLRMRSAPGTGNSLVRSLPWGTRGVVVGSAKVVEGLTWLEIQTNLGTGWVAERYLAGAPTGPSTSARFARGARVRVNTDSVNLRQGPGTDRGILATLGNDITGTVTDPPSAANNMWWVRIETAYGTGWVAEAFLASASGGGEGASARSFTRGETVSIDTDGINIRTAPGLSAKVVTILHNGQGARVVDGPRTADGYVWYKLETSSNSGWGVAQYLAKGSLDPGTSAALAAGDAVSVATDGVRIRDRAGLNGRWLRTAYNGDRGLVTGEPVTADGYAWVQVRFGTTDGWAAATWLEREGKAGLWSGQRARVVGGELNLRSGAGTGNGILAVLPDGAYVDVVADRRTADGYDWVRVTSSRYGSGWCVTDFLIRV